MKVLIMDYKDPLRAHKYIVIDGVKYKSLNKVCELVENINNGKCIEIVKIEEKVVPDRYKIALDLEVKELNRKLKNKTCMVKRLKSKLKDLEKDISLMTWSNNDT